MQLNFNTYSSKPGVIHSIDARVKILVAIMLSVALFFISTFAGLTICAILCAAALVLSKIPVRTIGFFLLPLVFIFMFTMLANSFSFEIPDSNSNPGISLLFTTHSNTLNETYVQISSSFYFLPQGALNGLFYVLRIIVLVVISLVMTLTTKPDDISKAIVYFMSPMKYIHVPVQDIATSITIAIRFIPQSALEFSSIHTAQMARGAHFADGGIITRLKTWGSVMVPMFVALFRRADFLAIAMDARAYGGHRLSHCACMRTSLHPAPSLAAHSLTLVLSLLFCLAICFFF